MIIIQFLIHLNVYKTEESKSHETDEKKKKKDKINNAKHYIIDKPTFFVVEAS